MKTLLLTLVLVFVCVSGFAQQATPQQPSAITVNRSDLPPDVLAKLDQQAKVQAVTQNIETVHQWAGMGKEIGVSINEGLGAVNEQTAKFAQTPVGKLTMFLIGWKVMSKDLIDIIKSIKGTLLGIPFLLFVDICLFKIWSHTTHQQRKLVKTEGKLKTYEYQDTWFTKNGDGGIRGGSMTDSEASKLAFVICFFVFTFIANLWIFAGVIL